MRRRIAAGVASLPWLRKFAGQGFYAVGGAWRALAGLHMAKTLYPLHIIHHYSIKTEEALDFARWVATSTAGKLTNFTGLSRRDFKAHAMLGEILAVAL